jgi:hypothetical protein
MGGFFGVASKTDCVADLFFGTDYHSHLGTMRGGMAVTSEGNFTRVIHDITNAQFRSKFEDDLPRIKGNLGIGVISDYEDQPLVMASHLAPTLWSPWAASSTSISWQPRHSADEPHTSPKWAAAASIRPSWLPH